MLIRILVSAILLPLLLAVLFITPAWILPCAYALICALAQHELLFSTGIIKSKPLISLCAVTAAAVPFWFYFQPGPLPALGVFCIFIVALFFIAMLKPQDCHLSFEKISCAVFGVFGISAFLSLIIPLAHGENGVYVVLLPFIVAWMSDTGAYFAGSLFGRHKLCPKISPKKTVEGSVGGVLLTVLSGIAYALIVGGVFDITVYWPAIMLITAVGSVVGQFGDLMFSFIKREFGIKDYGRIFPGHGGILDRFDSIVLTTPFVYLMLRLLPVIIQ